MSSAGDQLRPHRPTLNAIGCRHDYDRKRLRRKGFQLLANDVNPVTRLYRGKKSYNRRRLSRSRTVRIGLGVSCGFLALVPPSGKVLGNAKVPSNTSDFSAYLLQAQASQAKVVGFVNGGGDKVNSIKQAAEFGLPQSGQTLAGLLVYINDVNSMSLAATQGMFLTSAFYWDRTDASRAFARRWFARMQRMPNMSQAGVYLATLHYLQAVRTAGTTEATAVM